MRLEQYGYDLMSMALCTHGDAAFVLCILEQQTHICPTSTFTLVKMF